MFVRNSLVALLEASYAQMYIVNSRCWIFFASIEPATSGQTGLRSDQLSYFDIVSDSHVNGNESWHIWMSHVTRGWVKLESTYELILAQWSEDCFYYCSERNNVVVLFGTLKVQSFILTEASGCGLLIVVTSSTFLKRQDMLKEKSS